MLNNAPNADTANLSPQISEYTPVEVVLRRVLAHANLEGKVESVPAFQSYARVLAADVVAPADVPSSSTSHMDGYAVISDGLLNASASRPVVLRVVDAAGPGARSNRSLRGGETIQVATGAVLPWGADVVVPVESVDVRGKEIRVGTSVQPGEHVYRAGQDVRRGDLVLARGHRIRSQDVGILVSLGFRRIQVRKRPRVAVLATGSELTSARRPKKGKTVESHSLVFLRLAESLGCTAVDMGIVRDDPKALRASLTYAISKSDFVLTLGGTSAGKHDLVVDAVSSLEPEVLVHGLQLDRGRVTGVASVGSKPIMMLPGPIQAAANAFLVAGVPIIAKLSGSRQTGISIPCVLGAPWVARKRFSDFEKVVYVKLSPGRQEVAEPIAGETESMKLLTSADGYFVVPKNVKRLEAGDPVDVRLVPGFSFA